MPAGWTKDGSPTLDAVFLNFGSNLRDGNVTLPNNFNGVVYSEKNIVVKGNPPQDIHIVSEGNVFMAGDFNQAGNAAANFDDYYGLPQDYESGKNAMTATDYAPQIKERFKKDAEPGATFRHHVAATVVAQERVVYDYRSPVDCFENELYPYMKYKLACALDSETSARANCLERNRTGTINLKADSTAYEDAINQFFVDYPIESVKAGATPTTEDDLKTKLKDLHSQGNLDFDKFDEVCREVWQGYAKNYETSASGERGAPSDYASDSNYGVYKFLSGLRAEMGVPGNGNQKNFDPNNIVDKAGDFIYYPELTTNAMFISCGKLNTVFYTGPDVVKYYNKIGCLNNEVGRRHSETNHFVHRVFGSEIRLRTKKVHRIGQSYYIPPTRRKIYDSTLPHMGLDGNEYELTAHIVISWKDIAATIEEYEAF
jgi:hypothetical protein